VQSLDPTRAFVKVVVCGTFSGAAKVLRVPKSTISKMVSRLERDLGAQLLVRTTRAMALTPAGRTYFEACRGPLEAIDRARDTLVDGDGVVAGQVCLTAPEDFGARVVSPILGQFVTTHPKLSFEVRYTDTMVDLVRDGIDLAVRLGELSASRMKARKVGETVPITVASPAYLRSRPAVREPQDLLAHTCLSIFVERTRWRLRRGREVTTMNAEPRVVANQMTTLLELALQGVGIARVPAFLCRSELHSGALVRVLPEWTGAGVPVSLVSTRATTSSTLLRLVADRLANAIAAALAGP
jgi:LysR family transcriptional regulator, regulator for bpeEF and oprC